MFIDMPFKGFSQNRKKGYWPEVIRRDTGLKLSGSDRSWGLDKGITLAAFRAGRKLFCSMHKF